MRALRLPNRWDEVAWLYSAYPSATVDALEAGDWGRLTTEFTGLHPPLWPLLHALWEWALPVPGLWLLSSALLSLSTVALVARHSLLAGLVLALSPLQLAYAAEVNQYPLATAWVALAFVSREEIAAGRRTWGWLALATVGGGWTHALAGLAGGLAALSLGPRVALRVGAVALLAALPLLSPLLDLAREPGSFRQPPFRPALVAEAFQQRFGWLGLVGLAPLALLGARARPGLAAACGGLILAWMALVAGHIAAPHQFPYLLLLGVPVALLVGAGASRSWQRKLVIGISLLQGGLVLVQNLQALHRIVEDPPRAIDLALAELRVPWSCPPGQPPDPSCSGDALYLLAPPGLDDDDKSRTGPVLWRLRPWWPMPRIRPYPMRWGDHREGQPRRVKGHVVYVNDHTRDRLQAAIAAHPRLWLVVYEQGRRAEFTDQVQALVGQAPVAVAGDHLYRLAAPGDPTLPGR